jgi:MFS family permease
LSVGAVGSGLERGSLIVFRVIEGAGAGPMMPIITALLAQAAGWWAG